MEINGKKKEIGNRSSTRALGQLATRWKLISICFTGDFVFPMCSKGSPGSAARFCFLMVELSKLAIMKDTHCTYLA